MARSGAQSYRYQFDNLPEDRWEGVFDLDFEALLHSVKVCQFASGQKFALSHANLKRAIEEQKEKYESSSPCPRTSISLRQGGSTSSHLLYVNYVSVKV